MARVEAGGRHWGIVARYLLVAIQVTSWFMRRLPRRVWHAVHLSSVPLLVTGTVHRIAAGKDRGMWVVIGIGLACMAAIVWIATFRVVGGTRHGATTGSPPSGRRGHRA